MTITGKRKADQMTSPVKANESAGTQPTAPFPTNKELPSDMAYPATPSNQWKFVTWNVCSLPAAVKKGFKKYVRAEDPTVLCLQETKVREPMALLLDRQTYPYQYWHSPTNGKKGYSGTAIFSKVKPLSVAYGLKPTDKDQEGRVITLEFDDLYLVACYVPNSGSMLVRLPFRQEWDKTMNEYITKLEQNKPVIWTGDLNVAHKPQDLARPKANQGSACFTLEERQGFSNMLETNPPRTDVFRHFHPNETSARCYTFFSYRFNARQKGIGWRLDYFVVSEQLLPRVVDIIVRSECYGASDHVPLVMWLKRPDAEANADRPLKQAKLSNEEDNEEDKNNQEEEQEEKETEKSDDGSISAQGITMHVTSVTENLEMNSNV